MYYENFAELCEKNHVTPNKVSRETGISTATLTSWKQGKYTPKTDKLKKIADYFNVSVDYIMRKEDVEWDPESQTVTRSVNLSEEEEYILLEYRNADATQKEMIRRIFAYSDKMSKGE